MNVATKTVPCPRCKRDLPAFDVDLRTADVQDEPGSLVIEVSPRLDRAWKLAVRLAHPWCFGGKDDHPLAVAA